MGARELDHVNVDTTVGERVIAFPTNASLYHRMHEVLVKKAEARGIKLCQSYHKVGKKALVKQVRYSTAHQSR